MKNYLKRAEISKSAQNPGMPKTPTKLSVSKFIPREMPKGRRKKFAAKMPPAPKTAFINTEKINFMGFAIIKRAIKERHTKIRVTIREIDSIIFSSLHFKSCYAFLLSLTQKVLVSFI